MDGKRERGHDVARLYGGVTDLWASIHLAGGFAMGSLTETDKAGVMRMLNMNFVSCCLCCRSAVQAFGKNGGWIVNVASCPALEPWLGAGTTAYTASKTAVAAFSQALAAEVANQNILVNAVARRLSAAANRIAMPKANHGAGSDGARKMADAGPPLTIREAGDEQFRCRRLTSGP